MQFSKSDALKAGGKLENGLSSGLAGITNTGLFAKTAKKSVRILPLYVKRKQLTPRNCRRFLLFKYVHAFVWLLEALLGS